MAKSNEPIVWSLFSAGGVLTAVLVPVLILLLGFVLPLGEPDYKHLAGLLTHPLARIILVVLGSLAMFHWAHRFRFTLVDVGLKAHETLISVACYGSAIAGTAFAVYALWL